jgi:hypothetical protein
MEGGDAFGSPTRQPVRRCGRSLEHRRGVRLATVLLCAAGAALGVGCGGHPVSRGALEHKLRQHYRAEGFANARVTCSHFTNAYHCAADRGGNDGADGIERTTYSLTGDQKGDTSLSIP